MHSQLSQGTVFESSEDTGLDGIGGADMDFGRDHGAIESRNGDNSGLDSNHSSPLGYELGEGYQVTRWNGPDDEDLRGEWFDGGLFVMPTQNLTAS